MSWNFDFFCLIFVQAKNNPRRMKIITFLLSMFTVLISLNAQGGWSTEQDKYDSKVLVAMEEVVNTGQLGAIDDENRILFIDFETYLYNIKGIEITDSKGEIVYSRDTQNLPVDAIIDIDFNKKPKGYYTIWVDTYIGIASQIVSL